MDIKCNCHGGMTYFDEYGCDKHWCYYLKFSIIIEINSIVLSDNVKKFMFGKLISFLFGKHVHQFYS
jgi:hypothetical protein